MKECKTAICSNSVVTMVLCWKEKKDFCGDRQSLQPASVSRKVNYFVGILVLLLITSHKGAGSMVFTNSFFVLILVTFIIKDGIFS